MRLALDAQKYLVEVPRVARLWPAPLQRVGEQPAEGQAPLANALLRHYYAAGGQDGLDFV